MNFRARLCGCLSVLMLLLSACSGGGGGSGGGTHGGNGPVTPPPPPPAEAPVVTSTPNQYSMSGVIGQDTIKTQTVTVKNTDQLRSIIIEKFEIPPLSGGLTPISIDSSKQNQDYCLLKTLNPNTSCTYIVTFTVPNEEAVDVQQNIIMTYSYSNEGTQKSVPVLSSTVRYSASITPAENVEFDKSSPKSIHTVNGQPEKITITVNNKNSTSITITELPKITETSLSITDGNLSCLNGSIMAGKSCNFVLTLTPPLNGSKSGTQDLTLNYTNAASKSKSITETINFSYSPSLTFAAFPLEGITLNATVASDNYTPNKPIYAAIQTVVLYNRTSDYVTMYREKSKLNLPSGFSIDWRGCGGGQTPAPPKQPADVIYQLKAGDICALVVKYMPTKTAALTNTTIKIPYAFGKVAENDPFNEMLQIKVTYSSTAENNIDSHYITFANDFFSKKPDKFAIYNNCSADIGLTNKSLSFSQGMDSNQKQYVIPTSVISVKQGAGIVSSSYLTKLGLGSDKYDLQNGIPAINFYAQFGCNDKGYCTIGHRDDDCNNLSINPNQLGCQPDIGTKFEASLSCTNSDQTQCARNPSDASKPLIGGSFMDGSFVDGFSYNIALDLVPDTTEPNAGCFGLQDSKLNIEDFRNNDSDLRSDPERWSLNLDDQKWTWSETTPPMGWSPDMIDTPIRKIGRDNWNAGIQDLKTQINALKGKTFSAYDSLNAKVTDVSIFPQPLYCFDDKFQNSDANTGNQPWPGKIKPLTSIDLRQQSLVLQGTGKDKKGNPDPQTPVIGVAAPAKKLDQAREWGALGLGTGCFYLGGHYFNVPVEDPAAHANPNYYDRKGIYPSPSDVIKNVPNAHSFSATYSNLLVMYANPYGDNELKAPSIEANSDMSDSAVVYHVLTAFCKNHSAPKNGFNDFCTPSPIDGTLPGIAALFGNAGPVTETKYVKYVNQKAPYFYTWQFDDYNGSRVCDAVGTRFIFVLCGKSSTTPKFPVN